MSSLLSRLTVGAVGLTCKTFLNIGYCASVEVKGLENLEKALKDDRRKGGKGVITSTFHKLATAVIDAHLSAGAQSATTSRRKPSTIPLRDMKRLKAARR